MDLSDVAARDKDLGVLLFQFELVWGMKISRTACSLRRLHPSLAGALGLSQNLCFCCFSLCLFFILFFSLSPLLHFPPFHFFCFIRIHTRCPLLVFSPISLPLICYLLSLRSFTCHILFTEFPQKGRQALRPTFTHNNRNSGICIFTPLYLAILRMKWKTSCLFFAFLHCV